MSVSEKSKKIIVISSICVGIVLILLAIIKGTNLINNETSESLMVEDSVSYYPRDDYAYEKLDSSQGSYELDALNYDEANTDSKIKKVGSIDILVDDLDLSSDSIMYILDQYNGTVVSSSQRGEDNEKTMTITLKIPVEYFQNVYEKIQDIDGEIKYASYYTDDVTQEYTDLESRLNNLEATEDQLIHVLDTATTVKDTLSVYEQLTSIRSQIEVIKGQLKYLDNQVDYSYLTISLSLSDIGKDITNEEWKPWGVVKNAFSYLLDFGVFIADLLIWVIVFSPVIAFIVGIVILIKKKAKSKK